MVGIRSEGLRGTVGFELATFDGGSVSVDAQATLQLMVGPWVPVRGGTTTDGGGC